MNYNVSNENSNSNNSNSSSQFKIRMMMVQIRNENKTSWWWRMRAHAAITTILQCLLQMNELINKIGDHFGFEKPPFSGSDGTGGGDDGGEEGGAEEEAKEEKTAFNLKLVGYDDKAKIKVIKEVRAIAGLGLKEAKEMVEGAPKVVMKDIGKEAAEEMKEKLEAVGATIEIE